MPVMGGIEAAKIYNFSTSQAERLPIIILTANATTDALNECKNANIDSYLTKPINVRKLLEAIEILLAKTTREQGYKSPDNTSLQNTDATSIETLDYAVLKEIEALSTDNSFTPTLINNFIIDTEDQLKIMECAISEKLYKSYREHVHALKGSSGSIGAMKLHSYCKDEQQSYRNDSDYITSLKSISTIFSETKLSLMDYMEDRIHKKLNPKDLPSPYNLST